MRLLDGNDTKTVGERRSTRKPKVIICDTSAKTRQIIQIILGSAYTTVAVDSGEDALAEITERGADLVLADVVLPQMDGFELCRRIRALPELNNVPLVMVTAVANEESRAQGLEYGADDYLFKPIRPRELRARVDALLRLRFATLSLEARTLELETANRFLLQAQSALVQAEKLATVGTLVAGVAHEVNNPLAYIKSGAESLRGFMADLQIVLDKGLSAAAEAERKGLLDEAQVGFTECSQILDEIRDGASRLQRICSELKMMAVERRDEAHEVDLTAELEKAWRIASLKSEAPHELVVNLREVEPIQSVSHLIGQVVLNLFINAIQAMGKQPGQVICTGQTVGEMVHITIEDTGPGISQAHLRRVFDPFFTTKQPGQGTGLGLSVSRAIVQSLGGELEVASRPGCGAAFTLRLPRQRSKRADAQPVVPTGVAPDLLPESMRA